MQDKTGYSRQDRPGYTRRCLLKRGLIAATAAGLSTTDFALAEPVKADSFKMSYICSSAMYGTMKLADILPEVHKTGATTIDLWPKPHGSQHEQVMAMGAERFAEMLAEHKVGLGGIASYKFGAFKLKAQMELAKALGGKDVALVCLGKGPRNAKGDALKQAVASFVEQLKPHHEDAQRHDCVIAIENHSNSMISSPDSMKWLAEFSDKMPALGIAFAPHHLPQDAKMQAELIETLGGPAVKFFYAQQHGRGSNKKMPIEDELMQMPGRGPLDFKPILQALKSINYAGQTEIFMHPVPRGRPILETAEQITDEINRSRRYLEGLL